MNSSKNNSSDNPAPLNNHEVFTIMDDDEIPKATATIAEGSRRKSTAAVTATTTAIPDSPTIKTAATIGHRRRKTFHKILNADDDITFEAIIPTTDDHIKQVVQLETTKLEAEKSPQTQNKIPKLTKEFNVNINTKNHNEIDKTKDSVPVTTAKTHKKLYPVDYLTRENPNTEFIQRVAFLRSCVNYMLKSAGKETIDFKYGDNTLSKLVNNYNCVLNEPEEIVLSD